MQDLSFHVPLSLAVAEGASTPDPGADGVVIWSTTAGKHLKWSAGSWTALGGGASASPGGSENSVQRKSGTNFAGSGGFLYDPATGKLTLADTPGGFLHMKALSAEPATPAAGTGVLYFKELLPGHTALKLRRPSGVDSPIQDSIAFNMISRGCPGASGTPSAFGTGLWGQSGGRIRTLAETSLLQSLDGHEPATTTTAGNVAFWIMNNGGATIKRGTFNAFGGFRFVGRFGVITAVATQRIFCGLRDASANPTNIDYLTAANPGRIGLAVSSDTGNWRLVHNVAGTAPTVIDLGASFAVAVNQLLELVLFCAPCVGTTPQPVSYRVRKYTTTGEHVAEVTGTLSTNLPAGATALFPGLAVCNGTTAAVCAVRSPGITVESDF